MKYLFLSWFTAFTLAEADSLPGISVVANYGALGFLLLWYTLRAEPRMRAVESAIDRQTAAMMIFMIEIDRTSPQAKDQAKIVLDQIQAARRKRKEPVE